MSENIDNNEVQKEEAKKEEVIKRPRGRPKYEEGYNDHTFVKVLVDRLLEIEKKYLEIKNTIILECV